jgi:GT2 family glycosyltransferase
MANVGAVVIGRNEGERLRACLRSILAKIPTVIYVDSGSADASVDLARSMGAQVHSLDRSKPFSAARARNEGFTRLMAAHSALDFVQFVDGDAIMVDGWLDAAVAALQTDPKVAVVSGRRRETNAAGSVFNSLCNVEWNKPTGKSEACEGDALVRPAAFAQVGGFDASLIAGEEPELCHRLRLAGWDILRIHDDMTLHDVAMLHFSQWWKREKRAGHAYAEGAAMDGRKDYVKRSAGICVWGALLPLCALALAWPTRGISLLAAAALYSVLVVRAMRGVRRRAETPRQAFIYAFFCALGKFAMFQGILQYWLSRVFRRRARLIEYKTADSSAPSGAPAAE